MKKLLITTALVMSIGSSALAWVSDYTNSLPSELSHQDIASAIAAEALRRDPGITDNGLTNLLSADHDGDYTDEQTRNAITAARSQLAEAIQRRNSGDGSSDSESTDTENAYTNDEIDSANDAQDRRIDGLSAGISSINGENAIQTGWISTNRDNIATNTGNIATNTGNIATNTGDISQLSSDVGSNEVAIGNNTSAIGANTEAIDAEIANRIAALNALEAQLTSAIAAAEARANEYTDALHNLQQIQVDSNTTRIVTLEDQWNTDPLLGATKVTDKVGNVVMHINYNDKTVEEKIARVENVETIADRVADNTARIQELESAVFKKENKESAQKKLVRKLWAQAKIAKANDVADYVMTSAGLIDLRGFTGGSHISANGIQIALDKTLAYDVLGLGSTWVFLK